VSFQVLEELAHIPAPLIDMAFQLASKRRTVVGPSLSTIARSSREAATQGVKDALNILRTGVSGNINLKVDARQLNSGLPWLDTYANFVFRTLTASDAIIKSFAFRHSLEDQARLIGLNTGQSPARLLAPPSQAMITQAIADAEWATFNNKNLLATGLRSMQASWKRAGPAGALAAFFSDLVIPFSNTPGNVTARVLDYTPVGLVRGGYGAWKALFETGLTDTQQKAIVMSLSRSGVGTGFMVLGALLAAAGMLTGGPDDDKGDQNVQSAAGRVGGAILLAGRWHTVTSVLGPIGNLLMIGAMLHRQATRPLKNVLTRPVKLAAVGTQTVMEQPMLTGMQDVVEMLDDPGRFFESYVSGLTASFVPAFVNDAASLFDPYRRDARPEGGADFLWTGAQARVPVWRNRLPERRDVLGRKQRQDLVGALSPTIGSPAIELHDPILKQLIATDVGIGFASKDPEETDRQFRARSMRVGQEIAKELREEIRDPGYRVAKMAEKRKRLQKAINRGREHAADAEAP
jgi:hypothetical protein